MSIRLDDRLSEPCEFQQPERGISFPHIIVASLVAWGLVYAVYAVVWMVLL